MSCGYFPPYQLTEQQIVRALRESPSLPGQAIPEPGLELPLEMRFREAAVLVPLVCLNGIWNLVYTVRTESVQDHKGQVAFPGGAVEPQDENRAATALREAWEEIGLNPGDVRVLGYLDDLPTVSGYLITPVIGVIPWPYLFTLSPDEVKRVFTIPMDWVADPTHWEERTFIGGTSGLRRKAVFYEPYDGETLWGITARISVILTSVLKKEA